jgi:hypothetical protein
MNIPVLSIDRWKIWDGVHRFRSSIRSPHRKMAGSVIEAVVERKHELLAEFIASDSQKAIKTLEDRDFRRVS